MARKLKYKTLAALKAAYESGELDREADPLVIENDMTSVWVLAATATDPDGEDIKVFEGGTPEQLLIAALDLLGIPNRGA